MMSAPIEVNELNSIVPADAASYLRATGWAESDDYGSAAVWSRRTAEGSARVLLPASSELLDYPARMFELLSTLAVVERRSREEVLSDLRFPLLDVQHIRTTSPTPSGTTGLRDGYQAVRGVHNLFLAAATSAVLTEPLPVLPGKKPKEAQDFLRTVRLGPTGKGSFVLRVETPLDVSPAVSSARPRDVLLFLYQAVRSAHSAAEASVQADELVSFENHLSQGVSANLCQALADIGGPDKRSFDMTFSWAKALPVAAPTPRISFDGRQIEALKDAGTYLRDLSTTRVAAISGNVIKLSSTAPDRRGGKVVVEGLLVVDNQPGERQRVSVFLPAQHYELAVAAHQNSRPLKITGRLRITGQSPEITNVTSAVIE